MLRRGFSGFGLLQWGHALPRVETRQIELLPLFEHIASMGPVTDNPKIPPYDNVKIPPP